MEKSIKKSCLTVTHDNNFIIKINLKKCQKEPNDVLFFIKISVTTIVCCFAAAAIAIGNDIILFKLKYHKYSTEWNSNLYMQKESIQVYKINPSA